jgi:cytochrome c oxidase subunit 2
MIFGVRTIRVRNLAALAPLAVAVLLLAGCAATDPQNALAPEGPVARMEGDLFNLIFWIAVGVFVVVEALLLWTIIRHRAQPGAALPAQTHGNTVLEITWTIIPCIILAIIAVPTLTTIVSATSEAPASTKTMNVTVTGHQWWWQFDYPDQGVITSDELHIPVGTRINLAIESADVIHSFWIPKLGGKVQAIPNQHNTSWIQADQVGTYNAQCYQLCGASHANMRFIVVVQSQADFDQWVKQMTTAPVQPTSGLAAQGAQIFASSACVGCHTIQGTKANAKIGPNLSHIGSHQTLAGATLQNTPENLATWLHNPPAVKPGSIMPNLNLTNDQVNALVAYLESLK